MKVGLLSLCIAIPFISFGQKHQGMGGPFGQPNPLMKRVMEMRGKVKLSGIRVVQHLDQGERKVVTEKIIRDGVRIRAEVTDGPLKGQISVEDSRNRLVWSPANNEIRTNPAREEEFFLRMGRTMGGPERMRRPVFADTDGGRIAGVATRLLEMKTPTGQVVSQAWVDPVHGVILKFQTFDREGKRNAYLEYTSVKFDVAVNASTFQINKPGAKVVTPDDDLRRMSRELGFKPFRLPANSSWKLIGVRKLDANGSKILMQHYKGDKARVSLFLIRGQVDPERLGKIQKDGSRVYVWDQDGLKMALIGNLSSEELSRLAGTVAH